MEWAKKESILLEAARCFARYGFRKASIDQIAKKAGVAKGTVYLAVESKEDLFYQVLHREVRAWIAEVSKTIDPRIPADQLLAIASLRAMEYLDAHPLVKWLLFGEAHVLLPQWGDRLDELSAIGAENVIEILKLGIKQGMFRENLDVEGTARLLLDLELAYFVLHDRKTPRDEGLLNRRRLAAMELVLNGIRAR